jgi:hypothetical protein
MHSERAIRKVAGPKEGLVPTRVEAKHARLSSSALRPYRTGREGRNRAVPKAAQDRIVRGPFAALLILLSLLVGSGTAAAAGFDLRQSAPRLGPSRQTASVGLLPVVRNSPDEDSCAGASAGSVPPTAPGLVTRGLWTRPAAGHATVREAAPAKRSNASYRARAPPAA